MKKFIKKGITNTTKAPRAIGPYSQAVKVNNFIFVSGQIPFNPETMELISNDIKEQTGQCLKNIQAILEANGLDLNKVVKTTIFISDMVICELENGKQYTGNKKSLTFIKKHLGNQISEIKTGVPEIAEDLRKLKVDPGDESIRRIINQYEDEKPIDYDVLPKRFMNEPLPSGRAKGSKAFISEDDYNQSLQLLYKKRGLDEYGTPKISEIERLGIE